MQQLLHPPPFISHTEFGAFVDQCAAAGYDPRGFRLSAEASQTSSGRPQRIIGVERQRRTIYLDGSSGNDWISRVVQAAHEGRLGTPDRWA